MSHLAMGDIPIGMDAALGHNGAGMLWVLARGSAHGIRVRIHTRTYGGTGVANL